MLRLNGSATNRTCGSPAIICPTHVDPERKEPVTRMGRAIRTICSPAFSVRLSPLLLLQCLAWPQRHLRAIFWPQDGSRIRENRLVENRGDAEALDDGCQNQGAIDHAKGVSDTGTGA